MTDVGDQMMIDNAQEDDSGEYSCHGKYQNEEISSTAEIKVTGILIQK